MRPRNRQSAKYRFDLWNLPSVAAIVGTAAVVAIVTPVRAAVLNDWTFDPASRQFNLTLPANITPQFFLLAEPARIVLEVPGTTLGNAQVAEQYSGTVRSIRLSEVTGGTRVVIELAPNTRLDPRHAELIATDLGNGQIRWTLVPLLQDTPAAPIAAAPTPEAAAQAPTPAPAPPELDEPIVRSEPVDTAAPVTDTANGPEADTETASPHDEAAEADAAEAESPIAETVTEAIAPAPPPTRRPAEAPAELPSLPDIAASATVGAVQALPTGPDPLAGVSTSAADLEGLTTGNLDALPSGEIPIDPFADPASASVSVPSLADTDSTPAPAVTVPSIASIPDTPSAPTSSPTVPPDIVTDVPPEQVRPPGSTDPLATTPSDVPPPPAESTANVPASNPPDSAVITVPPPTEANDLPSAPIAATEPSPAPPLAPVVPPPAVTAANSLEIPTIPLPPDSWENPELAEAEPSQVRPPEPAAIAQAPTTITVPPPTASAPSPVAPTASPDDDTKPPFLPPPPAPTATSDDALPPPPTVIPSEAASIPPPPNAVGGNTLVPFGAPLPQTKSLDESSNSGLYGYSSLLPVGTRLPLQYGGTNPLALPEAAPVYEVLTVAGDVYDTETGVLLLPAGTQVLGRFEGFDESGRRFVTQTVIYGRDRLPLLAESDWLVGDSQPNGTNVALGSSIGAAAVTLLAGFSGVGLVGGAAMGAAAGFAESPSLVTVEPGAIIEVEVVSDILPFNDAPDVTRAYRERDTLR